MAPSVIVASSKGDPAPEMSAEVHIIYAAGGALRLPTTTYPRALLSAWIWAEAMHREGKEGVIVITL
jgi:hypothetical protein